MRLCQPVNDTILNDIVHCFLSQFSGQGVLHVDTRSHGEVPEESPALPPAAPATPTVQNLHPRSSVLRQIYIQPLDCTEIWGKGQITGNSNCI